MVLPSPVYAADCSELSGEARRQCQESGGNLGQFQGSTKNLFSMLRGMVKLARVVMMFVAALLGIICGVMWYTGQQQAQGMLQKFFVAVFFIFGATAILDAILAMTVGSVQYAEGKQETQNLDCNWTGVDCD